MILTSKEGINIEGRIIKGIGGFYYVEDDGKNIYECRACGRFRKEGIKPIPGDFVIFSITTGKKDGVITKILPRYNELKRPSVANIDKVIIVLSATKPEPDLILTDKLIIAAIKNNIVPLICINKAEEEQPVKELKTQFAVFRVIITSVLTGKGFDELIEEIKNCCVCLAGQSAVGKSSIINALRNEKSQDVGGLSKKTARGKHTTRATELLAMPNINGIICDTPGFSVLDSTNTEITDIINGYPEFMPYLSCCRYSGCRHLTEPECGVKNALDKNLINKERYIRYRTMIKDLM